MSQKRVRIIDVVIDRRPEGIAVATSPNFPEFYLVTKQDRLDEDIPAAIQKLFDVRLGIEAEILPVGADDEISPVQWAAIVASKRNRAPV